MPGGGDVRESRETFLFQIRGVASSITKNAALSSARSESMRFPQARNLRKLSIPDNRFFPLHPPHGAAERTETVFYHPKKEGLFMRKTCKSCGHQIAPGAEFCTFCGARVTPDERDPAAGHAQDPDPSAGPIAFLKASIRAEAASLKQFLKNPKQWIPVLVLSLLWLILAILPALGVDFWFLRVLSFLTFAQGGMYGGVWGAVGGVIGKAVFAYFVSALLLPLFSGKSPFKNMGKSYKAFFSGLAVQSLSAAAPLICGIGIALIVFNFLTGNASMINSMAGIVGLVLAVRSLLSKGGFFWGLLLSVASRISKGRIPAPLTVSRAVTGYAAGSAAGVALSAIPVPFLPYLIGALLLIVGIVVGIVAKSGKEAATV